MNMKNEALLIKNPVAVMSGLRGDAARLGQVDIRIRNGVIEAIAPNLEARDGERVIDARCVRRLSRLGQHAPSSVPEPAQGGAFGHQRGSAGMARQPCPIRALRASRRNWRASPHASAWSNCCCRA